jgi:competence protein ComEC
MLLGYCYAAWMAQQRLADALPDEWQGKNIVVTGIVAEMPRTHERGLRFVFDVESVQTPQAHVPQRILQHRATARPAAVGAGEPGSSPCA